MDKFEEAFLDVIKRNPHRVLQLLGKELAKDIQLLTANYVRENCREMVIEQVSKTRAVYRTDTIKLVALANAEEIVRTGFKEMVKNETI